MKSFFCILVVLCTIQTYAQDKIIDGNLAVNQLDIKDKSPFKTKSIFARLSEGGDGTYLGAKSYATQTYDNIASLLNVKSFSLEHSFYGEINSSINFYRGYSTTGGSIGISVADGTEYFRFSEKRLDVNGTIRAKEVKIESTGWADFVFDPNYNLSSLADVKKHIEEKKRLPDIPSATEVKENGVDVGEMQIKLLQKIEELTLYVIEQNEKNKILQEEIIQLRAEVDTLKNKD